MARRILSHKALRADFDAAERRKKEATGESGEQADEVEGEAVEAQAESGAGAEAAPKKKRKPAAPKEPKPKRTRTPKVVRQRVVWVVFNNSNARVKIFRIPRGRKRKTTRTR